MSDWNRIWEEYMEKRIGIDEQLLLKAHKMGGIKSEKELVEKALEEFIQRRNQAKILELAGTIEFQPNYDHKANRKSCLKIGSH